VTVGGESYTGKNVILASGSYSRTLPGLEIDGTKVIASEHALLLDRVPDSVVVLGGGVIGCEFASVWKSFGADVTIVEALPHLVPLETKPAPSCSSAPSAAAASPSSWAPGSPQSSPPTAVCG
jgi:dihydrolipoamide dehydrogenase